MIIIKRKQDGKYVLEGPDGIIAEYDRTGMRHPRDWFDDAVDAGAIIDGPTDWEYIDARDQQ